MRLSRLIERSDLDQVDRAILHQLIARGRMSLTELAQRVGLSKTPVTLRVKRLENERIITGYGARISWTALGQEHISFVEVRLSDTREPALSAFRDAVMTTPEIVECHLIAGSFDFMLKIRTKDIGAYRQVLAERITALPPVCSTSTHVVMEAVKSENL